MATMFEPGEFPRRTWQTCPIVLAVAEVKKKRLCTPSTNASESTRFVVTSESGRPALIPNS